MAAPRLWGRTPFANHGSERAPGRARLRGSRVAGRDGTTGARAARLGPLAACLGLAGCGVFGGGEPDPARIEAARAQEAGAEARAVRENRNERSGRFRGIDRESIFDLFQNSGDPDTEVAVNRFIWNASLEVLDFLPIEAVDPFTGVIVMGFGTPPGGSTPYRATIYVQDPALDARSLNVALATRSGPAPAATQRTVEDAILTRARQLRIAAGQL